MSDHSITTFVYHRLYYVGIGIIIFILGMSYFFLFSGQLGRLQNELNLDQYTDLLTKKRLYVQELKRFNANYQALDQSVKDASQFILPQGQSREELYASLERLAQENGVILLSVAVSETMDTQARGSAVPTTNILTQTVQAKKLNASVARSFDFKKMQVVMKLGGGSYVSYKNFFRAIQQSMRILDVTSFSYETSSQEFTIHMTTYYLQKK